MKERWRLPTVVLLLLLFIPVGCRSENVGSTLEGWRDDFGIEDCELSSIGRNEYFVLEPGFRLLLESRVERLSITVLTETVTIDGVEARVVEEREWRGDELIEVSRNFFAICPETEDVYYFGEEVDDYRAGRIVGHGGAWLAGEADARAGLIMPGEPVVGMRYYQEVAPGVAMDRAEVVALDETFETSAGTFTKVLKIKEGSALKPGEREFKLYAPGIGLLQDQSLRLVEYGFTATP